MNQKAASGARSVDVNVSHGVRQSCLPFTEIHAGADWMRALLQIVGGSSGTALETPARETVRAYARLRTRSGRRNVGRWTTGKPRMADY